MVEKRNETHKNSTHSTAREKLELRAIGFSSLQVKDLNRILLIEQRCFIHPWSEESFREILTTQNFQSIAVKIRSGLLVGYIIFSTVLDELHILNVAVDPNYQSKGIGAALLGHVHKMATTLGCQQSFLEVRESNRMAQQLYEKFGYVRLGKRKAYYEDNQENALLMKALLT